MNRLRIQLLSAMFALTLALSLATSASAAKPNQGCGQGFEAMTIDEVLEIASGGFTREVFEAYDKNEDQILCVQVLERFPEQNPAINFDPVFIFLDNPGGGN